MGILAKLWVPDAVLFQTSRMNHTYIQCRIAQASTRNLERDWVNEMLEKCVTAAAKTEWASLIGFLPKKTDAFVLVSTISTWSSLQNVAAISPQRWIGAMTCWMGPKYFQHLTPIQVTDKSRWPISISTILLSVALYAAQIYARAIKIEERPSHFPA